MIFPFLLVSESDLAHPNVFGFLQRRYLAIHHILAWIGQQDRALWCARTGELQRDEFEYDLPYCEVLKLIRHRIGVIVEKTRYEVMHPSHTWEIDVYEGAHLGLVVAEIELKNASDEFPLPVWVGREITGEQSYSNQILAMAREHEFFGEKLP